MMRWLIPTGIVLAFAAVSTGWWFYGWWQDRQASNFDDEHTEGD